MALCSGALLASNQVTAGADETGGGFVGGAARAEGMQMVGIVPGAPVTEQLIDGGGPRSETAADSVGSVHGLASLPYPGETPAGGPRLLAGLLGSGAGLRLPMEVPGYPFEAVSSYPNQPESSVGGGPYLLTSKSTERAAMATAKSGADGGNSGGLLTMTADSAVTVGDDGSVAAKAITLARGVTIGPVTIGSLTSDAKAVLGAGGDVQRSSHLQLDGVLISGKPAAPSGSGLGPLVEALNAALKPLGGTAELSPARNTANGISSATLVFSIPFPTGPGRPSGLLRISFGYASASVQTGAGADSLADSRAGTSE